MAVSRNAIRLIESLRRAWPAGGTVEALARELDLQPWRVSSLLGRLEERGLSVEHTGQAVRLDPTSMPLIGELVELGLSPVRVGRSIIVFDRTTSTNDVAWQAARRRESDGLVVLAETQSAGRGRLGRSWFDRAGASLLFSVLLLDVPHFDSLANQLMMAVSVALAEAIHQAAGLAVAIRWPNDIYVHGRKLAGILVESRGALSDGRGRRGQSPSSQATGRKGTVPVDLVIGVGVNCNQSAEDFPDELRATAASLAMELGHRVDRTGLIREILRRLDFWLGGEERGQPLFSQTAAEKGTVSVGLHAGYLRFMDHQAWRVRIHHNAQTIEGTVRDVDPVEGLILELPAGGIAHFAPAGVTVEWLGSH